MNSKTKIKQAASKNLGAALEQLEKLLPDDSSEFNYFLILSSRNRQLKRDRMLDIERADELNKMENKLLLDFIGMLDELDASIFSNLGTPVEEQLFYEKIVVVCTAERLDYIKQLFSNYYFKKVSYYQEAPATVEAADLLLFDDHAPSEASKQLLQTFLEANQYVIYFGQRFPLDRDIYADRVYFTNSIFSLHARIKEMLDFMKYINPK